MKDLVFLMEPSKNEWITPLKIGRLYLNRFIIDEEAAFEIQGIHYFAPSRYEISIDNLDAGESDFCNLVDSEMKQKGIEFHQLKSGIDLEG